MGSKDIHLISREGKLVGMMYMDRLKKEGPAHWDKLEREMEGKKGSSLISNLHPKCIEEIQKAIGGWREELNGDK